MVVTPVVHSYYNMEDTIQEDSDVIAKHLAKQKINYTKDVVSVYIDIFDYKGARIKRLHRSLVPKEDFDEKTQTFLDSL